MRKLIKVQFKRRLSRKTDYKSRERALTGKNTRFIVRKTNRYIICQFVRSENAQDKVISHTLSKELMGYGWPKSYSMKNLSAAYLTGFLAASKVGKEIKDAALDIGMIRSTRGGKIYAALKGAVDAGIDIPHSEDVLPEMKRIENDAFKKVISKIKEKK